LLGQQAQSSNQLAQTGLKISNQKQKKGQRFV
jgi:hypothetical protein